MRGEIALKRLLILTLKGSTRVFLLSQSISKPQFWAEAEAEAEEVLLSYHQPATLSLPRGGASTRPYLEL